MTMVSAVDRLRAAAPGIFARSTHPASGIDSWLLRMPPSVSSQTLYFGKPSCDDGLRFLWFAWFTPWAGSAKAGRMLGVVDLERGTVTRLPDHQFSDGGAAADPATGDLVWANNRDLWRRGPDPEAVPRHLGCLPFEMTHRRLLQRLVTQPSISADGSRLLLDSRIGTRCFIGALDLADGGYEPWFCSPSHFNHGQFSPTDPELVLLAREDEVDMTSGVSEPYEHRMFFYRRSGSFGPVGPPGRKAGHEVWGADGRAVWFVDFRQGVMRFDIASGAAELVWRGTGWHTHASACERYVVADHRIGENKGGPAWLLRFLNRDTGRSIEFARMTPPVEDELHRHPHPRFCARDQAVIYTTLVEGRTSVAIVPTADLIAATA
ncbi:hypothetical protein [Falsiroseomonas sp.]|uniref:hypothetical protein n=1 Tax=Falsiroseomonas sp. TaxID=2870721 RepID=UPI003F7115A5